MSPITGLTLVGQDSKLLVKKPPAPDGILEFNDVNNPAGILEFKNTGQPWKPPLIMDLLGAPGFR